MTTVTGKVLSEVYGKDESSFDLQLMYMPMNSKTFHNDAFAEVITSVMAFMLLALANLGSSVMKSMEGPDE